MYDALSQLAYTAHVLSCKDVATVDKQSRRDADLHPGASQSEPEQPNTMGTQADSDGEYDFASGPAEEPSTDIDAATGSGGGAVGGMAMPEGSRRQPSGGLAIRGHVSNGQLPTTPQSAMGRSGGGDYVHRGREHEHGAQDAGRSTSRDDREASYGVVGRAGHGLSGGGGPGGSAVSGGGSKRAASRRPVQFWGPFNDWWRSEFERTGKRPTGDLVGTWYAAHAASTWGAEAPSLEETRTHAKCLRSVGSIREYFRSYRARKKARLEDGPAGGTTPGGANTPPSGFSAGGAATPANLAALSCLLPQLSQLNALGLPPLSPLHMMAAVGAKGGAPGSGAAAVPFFSIPDLEALQAAGLALGSDGGAAGRLATPNPASASGADGMYERTAFPVGLSPYTSANGLVPLPVPELDTGAAGAGSGSVAGEEDGRGNMGLPVLGLPSSVQLLSNATVPNAARVTISTVTTGSLAMGRSASGGAGAQADGRALPQHAPAVPSALPASALGTPAEASRIAAGSASAGGADTPRMRSRPGTPQAVGAQRPAAPPEATEQQQKQLQRLGEHLAQAPPGPFSFHAGSASGGWSGSDGGRSCGSTPPPVSRSSPGAFRVLAQQQLQHPKTASGRAGTATPPHHHHHHDVGMLPQQLLAAMPHCDAAAVIKVTPRVSSSQPQPQPVPQSQPHLSAVLGSPESAPRRQQHQQPLQHGSHQHQSYELSHHHRSQPHQSLHQYPPQHQAPGQYERRASYANVAARHPGCGHADPEEGSGGPVLLQGAALGGAAAGPWSDSAGGTLALEPASATQSRGLNRGTGGSSSPFEAQVACPALAPTVTASAVVPPTADAYERVPGKLPAKADGQGIDGQAEVAAGKPCLDPHEHQRGQEQLKTEPLQTREGAHRPEAEPGARQGAMSRQAADPQQSGRHDHHHQGEQLMQSDDANKATAAAAPSPQQQHSQQAPAPQRAGLPYSRQQEAVLQHYHMHAHQSQQMQHLARAASAALPPHPGTASPRFLPAPGAPVPDPADAQHQYPGGAGASAAAAAAAASALPSLRALLARSDTELYGMLDELSREQLVVVLHKAVAMVRQKKAHEERLMDELAQVLEQQGNLQAQLHVQRMEMARMYRAYVAFRDDRSSGGGAGGGGAGSHPDLGSGSARAMAAAVAAAGGAGGGGGFTSSAMSQPLRSPRSGMDGEAEPSHMTTHGQQAMPATCAGGGPCGPTMAGATSGVRAGGGGGLRDLPPQTAAVAACAANAAAAASATDNACPGELWPPHRASEVGATVGRPVAAEPASPSAFGGFSSHHSAAPIERRATAAGPPATTTLVKASSGTPAAASLSLSIGLAGADATRVGDSPTVMTRHPGVLGGHAHTHAHGHGHPHGHGTGSGGGSVDGAAPAKAPLAVLACSDGGSGTSSAF